MSGAVSMLWLLAAIGAALLGCAYLALSQDKHRRSVLARGAKPPAVSTMRLFGWVLVMASLMLCVAGDGAGFAALLWPLIVGGAAVVIAIVLAYRPIWLRTLVAGAGGARNGT